MSCWKIKCRHKWSIHLNFILFLLLNCWDLSHLCNMWCGISNSVWRFLSEGYFRCKSKFCFHVSFLCSFSFPHIHSMFYSYLFCDWAVCACRCHIKYIEIEHEHEGCMFACVDECEKRAFSLSLCWQSQGNRTLVCRSHTSICHKPRARRVGENQSMAHSHSPAARSFHHWEHVLYPTSEQHS